MTSDKLPESTAAPTPDPAGSEAANAPSIEVKGLTKRYGRMVAVDQVSFQVMPGEVVGFLGPNGAGKSTTMRILCGLQPATSGEAWICGHSVARDPGAIKSRIGYMPEQNPLPEEMRVIEYLRLRARLKNLSGTRLKSRVEAALDLCDLNRKARRRVIGTLSKGFRQRVGLADALLSEPEVIVLDEPTIGLDPHQIRTVRELISSLRGKMTVILSSHILTEIEMCCDKVIIINQGQVVASGFPQDLRKEYFPRAVFLIECDLDRERLHALIRSHWHEAALLPPDNGPARPSGFSAHRVEIPWELAQGFATGLSGRIHQAGGALCRLEARHPSLEDIFLLATRRTWDAAQDGLSADSNGAAPAPPAT